MTIIFFYFNENIIKLGTLKISIFLDPIRKKIILIETKIYKKNYS